MNEGRNKVNLTFRGSALSSRFVSHSFKGRNVVDSTFRGSALGKSIQVNYTKLYILLGGGGRRNDVSRRVVEHGRTVRVSIRSI